MQKMGANESDKVKIKKMAAAGMSVDKIAYELNIVESCVQSFMPEQPASRSKPKLSKDE